LAREAATAAEGNYELVRAAYAGGVTGILSLLDAQNTALIADLDAANALYDFITDFMAVQRAAGQIDLFLDEASRDVFIERLGDYLRARDME
jgi:outer membrane protein TolC